MYMKLNEKIDWLSKWLYMIGIVLALAVYFCPIIVMSYIKYYVNDLKEESFEMPSPMMYECDKKRGCSINLNKSISFEVAIQCEQTI